MGAAGLAVAGGDTPVGEAVVTPRKFGRGTLAAPPPGCVGGEGALAEAETAAASVDALGAGTTDTAELDVSGLIPTPDAAGTAAESLATLVVPEADRKSVV